MSTSEIKDRNINIKNRKSIKIDGVIHITGFNENSIAIETDYGRIIIEGKELKIDSLTKDTGEIAITGSFSGLYYSEPKKDKGLIGKFFK